MVRHSCDNIRCVNPEHLLLGTYQDNANDKMIRHRQKTSKFRMGMISKNNIKTSESRLNAIKKYNASSKGIQKRKDWLEKNKQSRSEYIKNYCKLKRQISKVNNLCQRCHKNKSNYPLTQCKECLNRKSKPFSS